MQHCRANNHTPKGLRTQKEIRLLDSKNNDWTKSTIQNTYKNAELEVCGALIEHNQKIREDKAEELAATERSIKKYVDKKAVLTPVVQRFQDILEKG